MDRHAAVQLFTWEAVGETLIRMAERVCGGDPGKAVVLGGASMGAAGALWAGCSHRVEATIGGLVLCIPPTCYEARQARAESLRQKAREQNVDEYYKNKKPRAIFANSDPDMSRTAVPDGGVRRDSFDLVMMGSAMSDFPSRELLRQKLESVPVLICGWQNDQTHPVNSIDQLKELIPHASVELASELHEVDDWPRIIAEFVMHL
eukprot:TRINITY_DN30377_c0_g1_i1.p2 TRINITY_DN30377_c0_g1~~TRINITY_DN30377_c0_g1_i1.p2  ORF type:complete len:205 (+),score=51.77 TRINITY_DN30377_c0_g1_i1:162-776(+)